MVDFGDMLKDLQERRALPPAERAYLDEKEYFESNVPHIVRDEAMRDRHTAEVRVVTLGARASEKYVTDIKDVEGEARSDDLVSARYRDDGGVLVTVDDFRSAKRIIHYPTEGDRISESMGAGDRLDPIVRAMDAGAVVSVAGRDVDRSWKDSEDKWVTITEFHALRIGLGEQTLEQLRTPELGSLTDAALRHHEAKGQDAKDSIARAYLAQPHLAFRLTKLTQKYEREDARKLLDTRAKGPSTGVDLSSMKTVSNER
jgi:hypothetical protein